MVAKPLIIMAKEDETQDASQDQPSLGSTNTTPAVGQLRETIIDIELAGSNRREALSSSAQAIYTSRSSDVRDILNISITVLVGSLALYSAAPALIKTPVLFFISAAVLLLCVIICLAARLQLTEYLTRATATIEDYYTNLVLAASAFKMSATQDNLRLFKNADEAELRLPGLGWFAKHGPHIVIGTFLIGIIGLGLSLLFRIGVS